MNAFIKKALYSFGPSILSAVYGQEECARCGRPSGLVPLCPACQKILVDYIPFRGPKRCPSCGRPLVSEQGACMECRERVAPSSLDGLFPLHTYRQWKKGLVFSWKMEGDRRLSPFFSDLLFCAIKDLGFEGLPVVPVPPRPGKIKKTGWDQVNDLSKFLTKRHGVNVQGLLKRTSGVQQKKLNRAERLGSMGAVYELNGGQVKVPKEVVLLDDIVTTGATMEKCAWLLKGAGAERVWGLCLFVVD